MNQPYFTMSKLVLLIFILTLSQLGYSQQPTLSSDALFGATKARHIGPALMSGRVSDIAQHPIDSKVLLVGTAGGGVWKSINGGTKFNSIFDEHPQSIGAVAFDHQNPDNIYWVGTGECWTRNSVSLGDGIYKTTDGGQNWKKMGLDSSERISAIYPHPTNSDVVIVGVLGPLWSDSPARGVYKTTDGGRHWQKILYVDEQTGCADLTVDPTDPNIMYAAMWQFRRTAWSFNSGGPSSALYKTTDGGDTWNKIHNGLPKGDLGRIAVAVAPSAPDTVYATVEAGKDQKGGIYRSEDGGQHWTHLNDDFEATIRPFYFSRITVHPTNPDVIAKAGLRGSISRDGGKTIQTAPNMHADIHDIVFDHKNPDKIYFGNDGGVNISYDRGLTSSFVDNIPVSQYYHITVDQQEPYLIYGGLQDNGSWIGPSESDDGIEAKDWVSVGVGDGFRVYPHPDNPNIVYSEMQGAENVWRYDLESKQISVITPIADPDLPDYRYNWNAALTTSMHKADRLYLGSQFLQVSDDMGETWAVISPDLTTNDPSKYENDDTGGLSRDKSGAENHCAIFTIGESPINEKVIWVGTDDGQVQVTQDYGDNWANVTSHIPDLPANTWCYHIEASQYDEGTAYAVFDGHTTGDMTPYVYKTTDYGKSWQSISTDDIKGPVRSIQEDIKRQGMLYLGTEFGLYISTDDGATWYHFDNNFPPVAVHALAMSHTGDLVAGTHGRGVIIIDQLDPIRQLTDDVLTKDFQFIDSEPFTFEEKNTFAGYGGNNTAFVGENPSTDISIVYYMKKRPLFGKYRLNIYDSNGDHIIDLKPTKRKGLNRVEWDGYRKMPKVAKGKVLSRYGFAKARVPAGRYTAIMTTKKDTFRHEFELQYPAKSSYTQEQRKLQEKTCKELHDMSNDLAYLVYQMDQTEQWLSKHKSIDTSLTQDVLADMYDLKKTLVVTTGDLYVNAEDQKLRGDIGYLFTTVSSYFGAPSKDKLAQKEQYASQLNEAAQKWETIKNSDDYQRLIKSIGKQNKSMPKIKSKSEFING